MAATFAGVPVELLHRLGAFLALAASLAVMVRLARPGGSWGDHLRSRFVLGVPWGTLVVLTGVVTFYLVVQHGWRHWRSPVTIAYHAWSYLYPLGVLTAAFAHSGPAHLIGNVTSALVVFPLAEYGYGHYPRERGSTSFSGPRTNPLVRALVAPAAAAVVVGLLTALFSWGPIIGFSGVVFAGIGFAGVRYPLGTVVALVAQGAVKQAYRVLQDPVIVREASERFITPPWAGIAVQGHALGLFLGVALGVLVFYRDDLVSLPALGARGEEPPDALRLWGGFLLLGLAGGLDLVWWTLGGGKFVLYRGAGLAVVAMVAVVVAAAVATPDASPKRGGELTSRQFAVLVLLVPLVAMAVVAPLPNVLVVADDSVPEGATVEVRDYTVVYAENVRSGMYSFVGDELFGEAGRVRTSGVIVVSERRNVWQTAVPKGKLAARGRARIVLGGPTWRETVFVKREGWSALGGPSAYRVRIGSEPGDTRVAYTSGNATAGAVLAGRNVSVYPTEAGGFRIRVHRNGTTLGTASVPGQNATTSAAGITFVRDGKVVEARVGGTRVDVFRKETY